MKNALDSGDPAAIQTALRLNWRLWTLFQADLLGADCPLPADLRSNLLSLAAFIDKQTVVLLGKMDRDEMQSLIEINRNLALGLYAEPDDGTVAPAVADAPPAEPVSFNFSV